MVEKKPLVGTWYALKSTIGPKAGAANGKPGLWRGERGEGYVVFQRARLWPTRAQAVAERNSHLVVVKDRDTIIDVRCRALSPRTKASKKRTR